MGEHACCRFARAEDRAQLVAAFVADALGRGHKVLYLCDDEGADALRARLEAGGEHVDAALTSGQLELRNAHETCRPDGAFDMSRMLAAVGEDHARALADGYPALSITGEMAWALHGEPGPSGELTEYEQRLAELMDPGSLVLLCQYDQARFAAGTLLEVAATHPVDVAPELAPICRADGLSAARVGPDQTLRLAGELDFASADTLAGVLHAHFHGDLRLDLADLSYVDVAGMRALRGRKGQRLRIAAASESVRKLLALLAWDTDEGIEVAEAA